MKRITENIESLNAIREKCKKKQSDFTKEELRHLNLVNIELQKSFGKKFVKPLDKSCGYCIITAMNSVHNYIIYEEPISKAAEAFNDLDETLREIEVEVLEDSFFGESTSEQLTGIEEIARQVTDKELSLPDLRKKYPKIKARSKTDFLKRLNEQE